MMHVSNVTRAAEVVHELDIVKKFHKEHISTAYVANGDAALFVPVEILSNAVLVFSQRLMTEAEELGVEFDAL